MALKNLFSRVFAKNEKRGLDELKLCKDFTSARRRLILSDYDGTLMPFESDPDAVYPDTDLVGILKRISSKRRNSLVLISGRTREYFDMHLKHFNITFVAEHGLWIRLPRCEWIRLNAGENIWMDKAVREAEAFVIKNPGSFIERKSSSIALHYRNSDRSGMEKKLSSLRKKILKLEGYPDVLEGNCVFEIKNKEIDKGIASTILLHLDTYEFILAVGDDATDEDMFTSLPSHAYTVKVGEGETRAAYRIETIHDARKLLNTLSNL